MTGYGVVIRFIYYAKDDEKMTELLSQVKALTVDDYFEIIKIEVVEAEEKGETNV